MTRAIFHASLFVPVAMRSTLVVVLVGLCWNLRGNVMDTDADARHSSGAEAAEPDADEGNFNVPMPTLGGKQFWADCLHFHKWRIQRNVMTGRHRLLDAHNIRRAWGSYEECKRKLDAIKRRDKLPAMHGKAVVVLHGLIRSRSAMKGLCTYLEQEGGYTVFNVSYPSSRAAIAEHAKDLANIVDFLEGVEEINFVAHSMGNIVLRHYLNDQTDPASGRKPDQRIKRIVMLAPPNHGAALARRLGDHTWFQLVTGTPGCELGKEWEHLEKQLATPECEFGILAGGKGTNQGRNPLLTGDDDLVVTVDETKLPGARDFAVLPVGHTFMMDDSQTQEYTLRFLQHGYFVSEEERRPLADDDS